MSQDTIKLSAVPEGEPITILLPVSRELEKACHIKNVLCQPGRWDSENGTALSLIGNPERI